jgi:hypothetical protein
VHAGKWEFEQNIDSRNLKGRKHTIGSDVDGKFIIIALKEVISENIVCFRLSRVRFQWWALMNTVMNLQVTRDAEVC